MSTAGLTLTRSSPASRHAGVLLVAWGHPVTPSPHGDLGRPTAVAATRGANANASRSHSNETTLNASDKRKYEIVCKLDSHSFTTRQGVLVQLAGHLDLDGAANAGVSPALVDHVAVHGIPRSWDLHSEQSRVPQSGNVNWVTRDVDQRAHTDEQPSAAFSVTPAKPLKKKKVRFATEVDRDAWTTPPKSLFVYNKQYWVEQVSTSATGERQREATVQADQPPANSTPPRLASRTSQAASPPREATHSTTTSDANNQIGSALQQPSSSLESIWQEMNDELESLSSSSPFCASATLPFDSLIDPDLDGEPTLLDLELDGEPVELPSLEEVVELAKDIAVLVEKAPDEKARLVPATESIERLTTPELATGGLELSAIDSCASPATPVQQTMSSMFSAIMDDANQSPVVDLIADFTRELVAFVDEDLAGTSQSSIDLTLSFANQNVEAKAPVATVMLEEAVGTQEDSPATVEEEPVASTRQNAPSPPASPVKSETQVDVMLHSSTASTETPFEPTHLTSTTLLEVVKSGALPPLPRVALPRVSFVVEIPVPSRRKGKRSRTVSSGDAGAQTETSLQDSSVPPTSDAPKSDETGLVDRAPSPLPCSVDTPPESRPQDRSPVSSARNVEWSKSTPIVEVEADEPDTSPVRPLKRGKRERSDSLLSKNKMCVPDSDDEDTAAPTSPDREGAAHANESNMSTPSGRVNDTQRSSDPVTPCSPENSAISSTSDDLAATVDSASSDEPQTTMTTATKSTRPRRTRRTTENWWDVNRALKSIEMQKQAWKRSSVSAPTMTRPATEGGGTSKGRRMIWRARNERTERGMNDAASAQGVRSSSPDPLGA
ncbi:hypothetical protein ACM66B_003644 [Microbotryomycetes sp. NB124-2]